MCILLTAALRPPVSMQSTGRGCDSSLPLKSLPTCFDRVTDRQKPKQVEYCRKCEMGLKPVNPWRIIFFFPRHLITKGRQHDKPPACNSPISKFSWLSFSVSLFLTLDMACVKDRLNSINKNPEGWRRFCHSQNL